MAKKPSPQPRKRPAKAPLPAGGSFPIVGIGASAGGLEAVRLLLQSLPADLGMSFVVVQHLDPRRPSALAEILAKSSTMPVKEVRSGVVVAPNAVYVIAPANDLTIKEGRLRLARRAETRAPQRPIDLFLTSLAEDSGGRAIGVILSGTGSDGARGLKAIEEAGGLTFAQDASAAHHGMPDSAIAEECVDFVLPPQRIAGELARVARHPAWTEPPPVASPAAQPELHEEPFHAILTILSASTGIDFEQYKQPTLRRRIERRMVLRQFDSLDDYLKCLRADPAEVQALHQEMLIQVTCFFRDAQVFEAIRIEALPRLLDNRPAGSALRIWVPGCATGEEVYSLGICVLEALKERRQTLPVKIFGSDVSEASIVGARAGAYPASIAAEVSARRLREFFVKTERGFRVQKALRDLCVFTKHDVTKDPPFSQIDLISCRNLLIYLGDGLQKGVIPVFHYALKPDGILVLGPAESVGPFGDLFVPIDKKSRLFRRTGADGQSMFSYGPSPSAAIATRTAEARPEAMIRLADWHREADRVVLSKYAPPGVMIDDALHVLQYRGHTGAFLEPAPGAPTVHVLQMAREGLLPDLQAVIEDAKAGGLPVRREHVRVKTNGRFQEYHLEAIPIALPLTSQRCMVVLFEPADAIPAAPKQEGGVDPAKSKPPNDGARQVAGLTQELAATKNYLQSVIEANEAAHEEMTAANEEITSSNEELQSTNEELETAKEELQATNEELTTVNDELQVRIREATRANDDLTNLIDSIDIPILMLGADLELRRFSPGAQRILNLRPGDVGRHISDFKPRIDVPDFVPYLEEVGRTLKVEEREVQDDEGRWFKMCIRPYRTTDDKIEGATLSFFDIDALKHKELQLEAARDFARRIVEGLRGALLVLDDRLRVLFANKTFYDLFQVTPEETEHQSVYGVGKGKLNTPQLRTLLEELVPANELLRDFRMEADLPALGRKALLINAQSIAPLEVQAQPPMILLSIEDVTEREKAERSKAIVDTAAYAILTVDGETVIQSFNRAAEQLFGYPAADVLGQRLELLLPSPPRERSNRSPERFLGTGDEGTLSRTLIGRRRDGTMFPVDLAFGETVTAAKPLYTAILQDTSERRAAERQFLDASENEQRRIGQDLHDTAAQALIGLSYLAHGLADELQEKRSPDAQVAARIVTELDRVLEQLRRIAKGMQPVQVDAEGLMAALSELAARTGTIGSVACTFECDRPVLLDDTQTATQLFLIAQEAVTNAMRHARPTRVRITLQEEQELLRLEIVDDGKPAKTLQHSAGMGLTIMKYRADLIGATLVFEGGRNGTTVRCAVDRRLGGPRQPHSRKTDQDRDHR